MLRRVVLLLLFANVVFFAWTRGWLDDVVGIRAEGDREPERLARQVRPETVVILPAVPASAPQAPGPAASGTSGAPAPAVTACFEAGPLAPAASLALQSALQAAQPPVPPGSWIDVKTERPGTWMVYMGKYADRDALARKEEELRRTRLVFEEVRSPPAYELGFSLGRFEQRPLAEKALEQFALRGIRTARVVELSAPATLHTLRVEKADTALAAQLLALRADPLGKGFVPCGS
jgi:hypothetical protein